MGLVKLIFGILGFLILATIGLAAFLYFTNYEVSGTITETGTDAEGSYVVLTPDKIPWDVKQHVDGNVAQFVCEGYQVRFWVQTQAYQVYDRQDRLVYDSEEGLTDLFTPTRCALLGA